MTRSEAIAAAGRSLAEGYLILDDPHVPVEEAARRAYNAGQPHLTVEVLAGRIRARRATQQRRSARSKTA